MAITSRDILILSDSVDLDDVEEEEEDDAATAQPAGDAGEEKK